MSLKGLVLGSALVLGGCATANQADGSGNAAKPAADAGILPRTQIKYGNETVSYFDDMDVKAPFPDLYMAMEKGDCAITITDKNDYLQMIIDRAGHWRMLRDAGCDGTVDSIFFIEYGRQPIFRPRSSNPSLFEKDFDSMFKEFKQMIKGGNDESK